KTWFGKTTLWEESAHTPLIIRAPGLVDRPGTLRQQPVSLVDIFPTLLTLTGAPALDGLGGDDLSTLLADAEAPAVSTALTTMGRDDHTLRTEQYRYIRFNDDLDDAELYDVIADPEERVNRIDDPAFSGVRLDMETQMDMALSRQAVPVSAPPLPVPPEASGVELLPPAPNPSASQASVAYRLGARGEVTLTLVDALGRRVAVLDLGPREPGAHRVRIPTAPLAPGVYVVRLRTEDGVASQRLVVAR
ncbi:MAG: sulfatase/phosphatase domain-containing protein, partial [Bacteroidota bacterium]